VCCRLPSRDSVCHIYVEEHAEFFKCNNHYSGPHSVMKYVLVVYIRPQNWVIWTVRMTMLEASQYLILYASKGFWPELTSQKRSSPAEIITTDIYVNRLATRLRENIGKYIGGGCGGAVGGRRDDPWGFFPRPQYVTGFGCSGNFCFVASWTAFRLLSGQCPISCNALMMSHVIQLLCSLMMDQ
jgi:hypothetical protein